MRFKFYDLFTYLTGILFFISFFQGWLFVLIAILTGSIALIYGAFDKKGLDVNPYFIITHFILTCISIYISYFTIKLYIAVLFQIMNRQGPDLQMLHDAFFHTIVDGIFSVLSLAMFIFGLQKAKWTQQTTTNTGP